MAKEILPEDDRIYENIPVSPVCTSCSRFEDVLTKTCQAFPSGIPDPIWSGRIKHKVSYRGDLGILYKKITTEELNIILNETKLLT